MLTNTLAPGGARGVALKSNFPLMYVWAERIMFVQEDKEVDSDHVLGNYTISFLGGKVGFARGESSAKMFFLICGSQVRRHCGGGCTGEQAGSQRCTYGRISTWCGSTRCQGYGE